MTAVKRATRLFGFDGSDPQTGQRVCGIGLDGGVYLVEQVEVGEQTESDRDVTVTRHDTTVSYRIRAVRNGEVERRMTISSEPVRVSSVQPVRDGVLLVGARARAQTDDGTPERTAVIYDWTGNVRRRPCLGDGIADVRTDLENSIWVSYVEEGVGGNYGWGVDGPTPIGRPGLVRFDPDGERQWAYDTDGSVSRIWDCYAMNLAGPDNVWLYPYREFPVVNVSDGTYRVWTSPQPIEGAHALAVSDGRVLLFENHATATARRLSLDVSGTYEVGGAIEVAAPDGTSLEPQGVFGVGDTLYIVEESGVATLTDW